MVSGVLGELLLLRVISTGTKIKNIYCSLGIGVFDIACVDGSSLRV